MKRLGIVTSGGDVPGLNACIRAITRTALSHDLQVIGVKRGYSGLIEGDFMPMDSRSVGGIITRGGTILGTARCNEFFTDEGRKKSLKQIQDANIDALVVIGGNGSLAGANALAKLGVPLIGVPKTIDNDQFGTDIAIGVDTALNTILDAVNKIKDTASSHRRAFLVETMGRGSGYLALASAIAAGAEMALVPEFPARMDEVASLIRQSYAVGKAHCIIMVAEGWKPGIIALKEYLHNTNNEDFDADGEFDVREVVLGHIQRGGSPSAYDRLLATRFGAFAVERLLDGTGAGQMVCLNGSQISTVNLNYATSNTRPLDPELMRLAKTLF